MRQIICDKCRKVFNDREPVYRFYKCGHADTLYEICTKCFKLLGLKI